MSPRRVALLDWDGTLRRGYTLVDWSRCLSHLGLLGHEISRRVADLFQMLERQEMTYDEVIRLSAETYATGLRGCQYRLLRVAGTRFATRDRKRMFGFVPEISEVLSEKGIEPMVVSGAPEPPLEACAGLYHVRNACSLELQVRGGCVTGRVSRNPGTAEGKRQAVRELLAGEPLSVEMAIGDSDADAALFAAAKRIVVVGNSDLADSVEGHFVHAQGSAGAMRSVFQRMFGD